jgi:sec-independent protein translocase protein TatA
MRMGPWEIALIVLIVLIVFGAGKLPEVGSALGKSIRSFRQASKGELDDDEKASAVKSETKKSEKKDS